MRGDKVGMGYTIATKAPIATTHNESLVAGIFIANNRPVTTADRLPMVEGPLIRYFWIRYSNSTQLSTDTAVTSNVVQP